MDLDFSSIAPYLKDPLVLIGFFLFLAFSFARFVLKRGIIPQLPKSHGYKILRLILLYGFIVGILIIVLGFALKYKELSKDQQKVISEIVEQQLENKDLSPKEQEGITNILKNGLAESPVKQTRLALVDVVVSGDLTFDFKLKNSGTDSAFLSEVRFVFYSGNGVLPGCMDVRYTLYKFPFSAAFRKQQVAVVKGTYLKGKFKISNRLREQTVHGCYRLYEKAKPYLITQPLKISQVVPPGGVDRFKIRFVLDTEYVNTFSKKKDGCIWYEIYEAHAIIRYDGYKELVTPKFQLCYSPANYTEEKPKP